MPDAVLNKEGKLSDEEFELFIQYHMSTCERMDLIGAGAHTLDILKKADC